MCPPAKVNGVWPFNDAWLRTSLEEARRQAPRNGASILDSARELGIRDAQARRDPDSPLVFHRDGIPIRRWRTAWRTACQAAGVPTRFLHDCRRTAARNLIRASVPERVAMLLTGHKTRAIFDRYNIINEQELLDAGDQLVAYLAQHAQATPRGRAHPASPRPAPPLRLVRRTHRVRAPPGVAHPTA